MNRADFLSALKLAKPGIPTKTPFAALMSYFFDGESVTAYNDRFAIQAPCVLDFDGGLDAGILFNWLGACTEEEFSLVAKESTARLTCGRSRVTTPIVESSDLPWKRPKAEGKKRFIAWPAKPFIEGLEKCSFCMNEDQVWSHRMGVTFTVDGKTGEFNSTTGAAMVNAFCTFTKKLSKDLTGMIIPAALVKRLVAQAKDDEPVSVEMDPEKKEWIGVTFESGTYVWGRLVNEEPQLDEYKNSIATLRKKEKGKPISVPRGFTSAIQRLGVVTGRDKVQCVKVSVKKSVAVLSAESQVYGVGDEDVPFPKHPNAAVGFSSNLLLPALEHGSKILFAEGSHVLVCEEGEFYYYLALVSSK